MKSSIVAVALGLVVYQLGLVARAWDWSKTFGQIRFVFLINVHCCVVLEVTCQAPGELHEELFYHTMQSNLS